MRTILTILFLLTLNLVICQTKEYKIVKPKPDKSKITTDSLDIFETYKLNSLTFIFGWSKKNADTVPMPRMIIKNSAGKVIFSKAGRVDSYIFRPTFFVSGNLTDPILVLAESGSEYSWGNDVFSIKDNKVTELGNIDVALHDTLDNDAANIAPSTIIKAEGNKITFRFSAKKIVFNPGGQNEKIYACSDIWFVYSDRQLRMHSR